MAQSKETVPLSRRAPGRSGSGRAGRPRGAHSAPAGLTQLQKHADRSPLTGRIASLTSLEKTAAAKGSLQPLVQRRLVAQLYRDLDKIYAKPKYDQNPDTGQNDKDFWLSWFKKVQVLLHSGAKMRESLRQLSSEMVQMDRSLAKALAMHLNPKDQRQVVLTGFVPPDAFRKLVLDGYLFEDYVRREHGVYSHQLQWYTVQQEYGETAAHILRQQTLNPRWNAIVVGSAQTMWDNIVDGLPSERNAIADLTIPNVVNDYILKELTNDPQVEELEPALGEVIHTDKNHEAIRGGIRRRYPRKRDLAGPVALARKAVKNIDKALAKKSNQSSEDQRRLQLERASVIKDAANLELRTTTVLDKNRMTIDWTGWVGTKDGVEPVLEPTIAKVV